MFDFIFRLPTRVVFGNGIVKTIGEISKNLQGTKVFLVTGKTSTKHSPHLPVIIASLEQAGLSVQTYSEIEADPSVETVDRGAAALKEFGADLVIAFGGGSPMDAAKSIAMLSANEGSISDYIRGRRTIARRGAPLICIPTTSGTGSEVTASAVTTDTAAKEKIGLAHDFLMPAVAVMDPELHMSMPPSVTAATGIDALTHAIESYVSLKATPLSDALALHAIRLIGRFLRRAYANGNDLEARSQMVLASLLAGGAFTNAGLGAVHGIAHPVGARFGIAHGVANGILLPYVMEYCLIASEERFRDIAVALGEDVAGLNMRAAAKRSVKAVELLNVDIGIPDSLLDAGVPADAVEDIVKDAATFRLLPNSPRKLSADDLRIIVTRALAGQL